ncbi:hypothetical protein V2605_02145 [Tenacibaculum maritimum]|uniref:hypothetical protein n=1 Tax=Tenacibaculum maritimum TaxID=107401 RepID=UPI0013301AB7|nr:hypothetical protein [Tenacibaculum maritimum]
MKTINFTLIISALFFLTTSCTDLTEDLITNDNNHIEKIVTNDTLETKIDFTGGSGDNPDNNTEKE